MTKDVIEQYDTFNTKGCTYDLMFGDFNDQPIPPDYYNILNDDNYDENNIPGTPVDDELPENEGAEDVVIKMAETSKMR